MTSFKLTWFTFLASKLPARVLGIGPEAPPSHLYTHAYLPPFETPSRSGFDFFPFNDHILVTLAHSPA